MHTPTEAKPSSLPFNDAPRGGCSYAVVYVAIYAWLPHLKLFSIASTKGLRRMRFDDAQTRRNTRGLPEDLSHIDASNILPGRAVRSRKQIDRYVDTDYLNLVAQDVGSQEYEAFVEDTDMDPELNSDASSCKDTSESDGDYDPNEAEYDTGSAPESDAGLTHRNRKKRSDLSPSRSSDDRGGDGESNAIHVDRHGGISHKKRRKVHASSESDESATGDRRKRRLVRPDSEEDIGSDFGSLCESMNHTRERERRASSNAKPYRKRAIS